MNVEKAKNIAMTFIMEKLGIRLEKKKGPDHWYLSPFRSERSASFKINSNKNVWYDHGEGIGGGVIKFVRYFLQTQNEDHTDADIARWLNNMEPTYDYKPYPVYEESKPSVIQLKQMSSLRHPALFDYLASRRIPVALGKRYFKEIHVFNQTCGNSFFALGMENENGGYELRNKFFKGSVSAKGITFIRGTKVLPDEVHVFEGAFDFVSALAAQNHKAFEGDVIILHSTSNLGYAFPYINNYSYKKVYSWLDNDEAGKKAKQKLDDFLVAHRMMHLPMNRNYQSHKDISEWYMANNSGLVPA